VNNTIVDVLSDNTFSLALPLSQIFNPLLAHLNVATTGFQAADRVVVIKGQSIADGAYSPQSMGLRFNQSGFDALAPQLPSLVNLDIGSLITPGTQIGCFSGICVTITSASFNGFNISIDSHSGYVALHITINNLVVN